MPQAHVTESTAHCIWSHDSLMAPISLKTLSKRTVSQNSGRLEAWPSRALSSTLDGRCCYRHAGSYGVSALHGGLKNPPDDEGVLTGVHHSVG